MTHRHAAESRCAELEKEVERQKKLVELAELSATAHRCNAAELEKEVGRLRALLVSDPIESARQYFERAKVAESRLATAVGLLGRVQKVYTPHPKLREDINDFLANPPAAPSWCAKCKSTKPCPGYTVPAAPEYDPITADVPLGDMNGPHGRLRDCPCGDGERPGHPLNWCGQVRLPPGPTRTVVNADPPRPPSELCWNCPAKHSRTESEQRVLDAMRCIPIDDIQLALDLRDGMPGAERRMWNAELARREAEK